MAAETQPGLYTGLPVIAYADRWQHLRKIGAYAYLVAVAGLLLFCGIAAPFMGVPLYVKLMSPVLILMSIPWLGLLLPVIFTLVSDLRIRGPILTIDRHGFVDGRSGASIEWSEIRSIRLIDGHVGSNVSWSSGVTIRLKNNTKPPPPTWKRQIVPLLTKPDEFHCSLVYLTERADPLAWRMKDMVKQAGGAFWNPRQPYSFWKAIAEPYTHIYKNLVSLTIRLVK